MAPAVNPQDLQSVRVVCSCNRASCWDDNCSRNQVFFVSGLHHQTQPSLGPCDFVMQQVACQAVPRPTSETKPGLPLRSKVGRTFWPPYSKGRRRKTCRHRGVRHKADPPLPHRPLVEHLDDNISTLPCGEWFYVLRDMDQSLCWVCKVKKRWLVKSWFLLIYVSKIPPKLKKEKKKDILIVAWLFCFFHSTKMCPAGQAWDWEMMKLRDGGEKRCLLLISLLVLFLGKKIKERREVFLFFFLPMGNHDPATSCF